MKACVLEKIGGLTYGDVAKPSPKTGEVLLQVKACGICSSDVDRVFRSGTYHYPTILGHEFSGEIVALGEDCDPELLGKRAVVFPLLPCFACPSCEEEAFARCENYRYFGSRNDGGFAEFLAVPLWNLLVFADSLSYEVASLCEPASVARHALKKAGSCEGKSVAIVGNGTIGLLSGMWAKLEGASQVFLLGRSKKKVDFGKELGFAQSISTENPEFLDYLLEETQGQGADIVLEMVGSGEAVSQSILACKKGGTLVLTGNPQGEMSLGRQEYWQILRKELTVKGSWNSSYYCLGNDWQAVITAMEQGILNPEPLITHKFSLKEWENAFQVLQDPKETAIKVLLLP